MLKSICNIYCNLDAHHELRNSLINDHAGHTPVEFFSNHFNLNVASFV